MEKAKKPSMFQKASDKFVRYYKKVRYARFVPFYIVIWATFGATRPLKSLHVCTRQLPCASWAMSVVHESPACRYGCAVAALRVSLRARDVTEYHRPRPPSTQHQQTR